MQEIKVLIVEDEPILRELLAIRIGKLYKVFTAANGMEGLAIAREVMPDLIMSDIMMPVMDGFAFQVALQEDIATRVIPFIFLTAKFKDEDRRRGLAFGVDDYIVKPFDLDFLLLRISRLVERYRFLKGEASNVKPSESMKVFLCHAKEDKEKIVELHRMLLRSGIDPWLDQVDILPGQKWEYEIKKAMRESHVIIICLSNHSISRRGYVQKEINEAIRFADYEPEGSIFIVPIRLEECQVPDRLSDTQWVDLFRDDGYMKLVEALGVRATALNLKPPKSM